MSAYPIGTLPPIGEVPPTMFAHVIRSNRLGEPKDAFQIEEVPTPKGGDHSLALGSISAVAAHCRRMGRQLRVLWLDAHADANTEASSPSGNLHGMPLACLLGRGLASLVGWGGVPAALQVRDLALIGLRSLDAEEKVLIRQSGLEVYDMRYSRSSSSA